MNACSFMSVAMVGPCVASVNIYAGDRGGQLGQPAKRGRLLPRKGGALKGGGGRMKRLRSNTDNPVKKPLGSDYF